MAAPIVLGITIRADGSAQVRRELGHVRDELNGAGHAAQGVNRQFADMAMETLNVGSALRGMMAALSVAALYQFVKEVVNTADQMKLLDSRLKVATSSVQDYAESQKELVAISLRTGTAFEANASMFSRVNKSMEAMGGTARDTAVMTELIAKSLSLSGTSAGEANSVIRQLSQAMASGVLRGDEFNSIMENGSRLAYALSAGIGVNVGELRKMAEAGELTSAKVIKAIMSQSAAINDEFSRMPLTVGAALENVKTAWGQYILQADAGTGATASLANQFNNLAKNLGPVIDSLIQFGTVAATVFAGQMLTGLGKYTAAQVSAIALEYQHGQAIRMNHAFNVQAAAARLAQTQVEIANTQAMLAGNLAMGVRMGLTNQLNMLTAAQTAQTAALSSATNAAAAAQRGLTAAFAINPFTGLIVSLSILVGLLINAKTQLRDLSTMSIDDKIAQAREGIEKQKSRIETANGPIGLLISDEQLAKERAKLKLMKDELSRYYKERDLLKEQERKQSKLAEIKTPSAEELKLAEKAEKARQKALAATAKGIKAEMDALHEQHLKLTLSERDYYAVTLAAKGMSAAQSAMAMSLWDANKALEAQKTSHDKAKSQMDALIDKYNQLTLSARDYYEAKLKAEGLTSKQIEPLMAQFDKNTAVESRQSSIDAARTSIEGFNAEFDKVKNSYASLSDVSSSVFDAASGGIDKMTGAFTNMLKALEENKAGLKALNNAKIANAKLEQDVNARTQAEIKKNNGQYLQDLKTIHDFKATVGLKEQLLNNETLASGLAGIRQTSTALGEMFEKNTNARRAFNVVSLAASVSERLADIAALNIKAAIAVAEQGKGDPYTAFARIAAMAAIMGSVLAAAGAGTFAFGGSGGSAPPPTSPDTGTVLGDSSAKSESVGNIYKLLQDIHASEYAVLRSIDRGISSLQTGITGVITRLFQAGGLQVPTIDGKAKLTSLGGIAQMGATLGTLGIPIAKMDPISNFILGGLFGKVTRSVVGSGIGTNAIGLNDLLNGSAISGYQYATIETKKKSWFSSKTSYSEQQQALDGATQSALNGVFKSMGETMLGLAAALGHDTKQRVEEYVIPAMKIDLHGLNGEDAAKKLNGVISAELDAMSESVFGGILKQYQQLGEGMLETTARIVSEIAVVKDALAQSGITLSSNVIAVSDAIVQSAGGVQKFQDSFEAAFDKFASPDAKQKRLVASLQAQLSELFPQATINTLARSREEYVRLVATLDQANPRYAEQYALLIKLADGADKYYTALEETENKINDLTKAFLSFSQSVQSAHGSIAANINALGGSASTTMGAAWQQGIIDRLYKQLAVTTDNAEKVNIINEINTAVMDRYNAELEMLGKVDDTIKQIRRYLDNLKLSDKSPLTNAQKFAEAQAQFATQLAMANAGDQEARANITSVADAYLAQAQTRYASSQSFIDIFNYVTSSLEKLALPTGMDEATYKAESIRLQNAAISELQRLDSTLRDIYAAEQTANAVRQTELVNALASGDRSLMIETAINDATMALGRSLSQFESQWIKDQFNSGRDKTAIYAEAGQYIKLHGSHADGLDYVPFDGYRAELHKGERVLTAAQARRQDGENDPALIAELRALRAEVAQLRAEQRDQTGALIQSHYDANDRASDKIVKSSKDAAKDSAWANRSKAVIE
jgi:tape measure domain-containing protein